MTKTEDAYEGTAARIETLMTEVAPEYIDWQKMVPMITAGSLYTGTFSAMSALQNPLQDLESLSVRILFILPFATNMNQERHIMSLLQKLKMLLSR